jgi:hypothetical protein
MTPSVEENAAGTLGESSTSLAGSAAFSLFTTRRRRRTAEEVLVNLLAVLLGN